MLLDLYRTTTKIRTLSKSGLLGSARKLFDEMPHRDLIAWNSMLTSYSQLEAHQEAFHLFYQMRRANTKPDHFSFTAILSACAGACELRSGIKFHASVIVFGYGNSLPVNNSLIDMYGKCSGPCEARRVFEELKIRNEVSWCTILSAYLNNGEFEIAREIFSSMRERNEIAWNTMIIGHARQGEMEICFDLLKKMRHDNHEPDEWTYSSLMTACSESEEIIFGCMIHAIAMKIGWDSSAEVKNSIMSFYARQGCPDYAVRVFESMETLTQISWNTIIDAYMKMGNINEAFLAFHEAPVKNVISWTSLITGYARNGNGEEALHFFVDMTRCSVRPDDFTFGAILLSCSSLAMLGPGKMVHCCIIRDGFCDYVYVGNGLMNMYAKGGDIEGAHRVFDHIPKRDLISWNGMLFALGLHGKADQALQLYEQMEAAGVIPDKVTFIGLLMACSHSGLIEKGRILFNTMKTKFGFSYEINHIACLVDMVGRSGHLKEARGFCLVTSFHEALLGACYSLGDLHMGTFLGEGLKALEPYKDMSYVLLSNIYCASGQWKEAEMIRRSMTDRGIKKLPGCSWIEVGNKLMGFVAGDHSHPCRYELYKILQFLDLEIKNPCYIGFGIKEFEICI